MQVQEIEVTIEWVGVSEEKIDNRKNKDYRRRVEFVWNAVLKGWSWGNHLPCFQEPLRELFKEAFQPSPHGSFTGKVVPGTHAPYLSGYGLKTDDKSYGCTTFLRFDFDAEKPSKIIGKEKAIRLIWDHLNPDKDAAIGKDQDKLEGEVTCQLASMVNMVYQEAVDTLRNKETQESIANTANWLGQQLSKALVKKADKRTRYSQRLSGLRAERKSEVNLILGSKKPKKVLGEWRKSILKTNKHITPMALEIAEKVVLEKLNDFASQHISDHFFRGIEKGVIGPADIELQKEQQDEDD